MSGDDSVWRPLARAGREALAQLGYDLGVYCLPDEPGACGGSFAEHAVAHLAALNAVADHHLEHLAPPREMIVSIYDATASSVDCQLTCRRSTS